jgi:hypothetical protein
MSHVRFSFSFYLVLVLVCQSVCFNHQELSSITHNRNNVVYNNSNDIIFVFLQHNTYTFITACLISNGEWMSIYYYLFITIAVLRLLVVVVVVNAAVVHCLPLHLCYLFYFIFILHILLSASARPSFRRHADTLSCWCTQITKPKTAPTLTPSNANINTNHI